MNSSKLKPKISLVGSNCNWSVHKLVDIVSYHTSKLTFSDV
ncbi:hypothetical protein [Mesomycoplasma conjunctivae]